MLREQARFSSVARLALLLLAGLLSAYRTPLRLMPTPVKLSTGEIDPVAH